jgi:mono/diheme cytochrome c family protein
MRRKEWTAVLAIVGIAGLMACERRPQQAPPAAAPPESAQVMPPESARAMPPESTAAMAPESAAALPPGVTAANVASGQKLFTGSGNCFTCHGTDAKGTALAPDLTSGKWLWIQPSKGNELQQIETIVKNGVPQPKQYPAAMPPMGGASLTPDQIRDVSAYVYSISRKKTS